MKDPNVVKVFLEVLDEINISDYKYSAEKLKKIYFVKWLANKFEIIDIETELSNTVLKTLFKEELVIWTESFSSKVLFKYKGYVFKILRQKYLNKTQLFLEDKFLNKKNKVLDLTILDLFFKDNYSYDKENLIEMTNYFIEQLDLLICNKKEDDIEKLNLEANRDMLENNIEFLINNNFKL